MPKGALWLPSTCQKTLEWPDSTREKETVSPAPPESLKLPGAAEKEKEGPEWAEQSAGKITRTIRRASELNTFVSWQCIQDRLKISQSLAPAAG